MRKKKKEKVLAGTHAKQNGPETAHAESVHIINEQKARRHA